MHESLLQYTLIMVIMRERKIRARARVCVCVFEERSHLLEQDFVLLVSSSSFHLMIQFGDDLILELQLNTAAVNNQCG